LRIALFGHGAMGRLIEERALAEGHQIVAPAFTSRDAGRAAAEVAGQLQGSADVAIDFSVADAIERNAAAAVAAGIPLVVGTTGWLAREREVRRLFEEQGGALIYGANFSIGVNLFYQIVERAATLFANFPDYAPFIEEAHHSRKRDAPSGTALVLRSLLAARAGGREIPVASTRAGHIPGTHRVGFDSTADQIMLVHTARSREGFAAGALAAARWIVGRRGVYEFSEMIEEMLERGETSDDEQS
jgi:4-hydroxy-tetrahydrodipicolinate reductase